MQHQEKNYICLDHFEGPLEFLLYLAKKDEIDLSDIQLKAIIDWFLQEVRTDDVDRGAEFIGLTANLLWLKSCLLLPEDQREEEEEGDDPHFAVIHQLIDYCRFKEAGEALVQREHEQKSFFARGGCTTEVKKPLGLDHLSLDDLAQLFQEVLDHTTEVTGQMVGESVTLSDILLAIRRSLAASETIAFYDLFSTQRSRMELIVTFLAILELMKMGEVAVVKEQGNLLIIPHQGDK